MEGDVSNLMAMGTSTEFQSTPSAWRETAGKYQYAQSDHISIHSLRMEGDVVSGQNAEGNTISIHSLRMEGDKCCDTRLDRRRSISIHSLRMEGDIMTTHLVTAQ